MISMDFRAGFFDTPAVMKAVDKATRQVLSKFGAFVRQRAKTSIRPPGKRRKKRGESSRPGSPPYSQTGTLKRGIKFAFDLSTRSVVVGPERFSGTKDPGSMERLEYGGTLEGDGRELVLANEVGRDARTGRFTSGGKTRVKLEGTLHYAPRPFMGPALQSELPGLPAMWRDSVR